jgi:ABC-type transport system involved in cytochrome bd biosynthesis fused ATPase/permease subunit
MNYVIRETAAAVVAAASDFIIGGRAPTPATQIEGTYASALESQREHDRAIGSTPITVELLNSWTIEARIGWMTNNFETDERYANASNIARRAMMAAPIGFPLEIERRWQKRTTKTW